MLRRRNLIDSRFFRLMGLREDSQKPLLLLGSLETQQERVNLLLCSMSDTAVFRKEPGTGEDFWLYVHTLSIRGYAAWVSLPELRDSLSRSAIKAKPHGAADQRGPAPSVSHVHL